MNRPCDFIVIPFTQTLCRKVENERNTLIIIIMALKLRIDFHGTILKLGQDDLGNFFRFLPNKESIGKPNPMAGYITKTLWMTVVRK